MKTNRAHRTERTAKEEYEILSKDIKNLMKMLAELLEKRAVKNSREEIHWGHVGDLQHTKSQLKETLASYLYNPNGSEEEVHNAIETELAKAR